MKETAVSQVTPVRGTGNEKNLGNVGCIMMVQRAVTAVSDRPGGGRDATLDGSSSVS